MCHQFWNTSFSICSSSIIVKAARAFMQTRWAKAEDFMGINALVTLNQIPKDNTLKLLVCRKNHKTKLWLNTASELWIYWQWEMGAYERDRWLSQAPFFLLCCSRSVGLILLRHINVASSLQRSIYPTSQQSHVQKKCKSVLSGLSGGTGRFQVKMVAFGLLLKEQTMAEIVKLN